MNVPTDITRHIEIEGVSGCELVLQKLVKGMGRVAQRVAYLICDPHVISALKPSDPPNFSIRPRQLYTRPDPEGSLKSPDTAIPISNEK